MDKREQTRQIEARGVKIGGGAPVTVQRILTASTALIRAPILELYAMMKSLTAKCWRCAFR